MTLLQRIERQVEALAAKDWLLGNVAKALTPELVDRQHSFAIVGMTLVVSPEHAAPMRDPELCWSIAHEAAHVVRDHISTLTALLKPLKREAIHMVYSSFNLAADLEVNWLISHVAPTPAEADFPGIGRWPDLKPGYTALQYLPLIIPMIRENPALGIQCDPQEDADLVPGLVDSVVIAQHRDSSRKVLSRKQGGYNVRSPFLEKMLRFDLPIDKTMLDACRAVPTLARTNTRGK